MNPTKLPAALEMSRIIMGAAIENFNRDGYLTMAAFLFGTKVDPYTWQELSEPGFQVVAAPPQTCQEDKDVFVTELASLVRRTRAVGVAVLAEAWTANVPLDEEHKIVPGRVHELSGAKEIAYFLLEHRDLPGLEHSRMWVAEIRRPVVGKPTMCPFKLSGTKGPNLGRMSRLMGSQ